MCFCYRSSIIKQPYLCLFIETMLVWKSLYVLLDRIYLKWKYWQSKWNETYSKDIIGFLSWQIEKVHGCRWKTVADGCSDGEMVNIVEKLRETKREIKPSTTVLTSYGIWTISQSMENQHMKGRDLTRVQHHENIWLHFGMFLYNLQ